jgi:hypothetical protein
MDRVKCAPSEKGIQADAESEKTLRTKITSKIEWCDEENDRGYVIYSKLPLSKDFTIIVSAINVKYKGQYILSIPRLCLFDYKLKAATDLPAAKVEAVEVAKTEINKVVVLMRKYLKQNETDK